MTNINDDRGSVPSLSNDKKLLELRINFFKNFDNKTIKYIVSSYEQFISAFEKSLLENNDTWT
jgi:hypothetical protein